MQRSEFYTALRERRLEAFRRLTQEQVDGCEAVLDECLRRGADVGQAAYVLATAYGETGGAMQPIEEDLSFSAERLREVWPSRFTNFAEAALYARNPEALANKVHGGRMDNNQAGDGWAFRGRGLPQITGRRNYTKWAEKLGLPLVQNPDLLMDLNTSVRALVQPMLEGWATGRKLPDFVSGAKRDYVGARQVWNGMFEAEKYAGYAVHFEAALRRAGYVKPKNPIQHDLPEEAPQGFWAAFIGVINTLFGRKST